MTCQAYEEVRLLFRHEQRVMEQTAEDAHAQSEAASSAPFQRASSARQSARESSDTLKLKRATRHMNKLNMGDTRDDIHVCIMCLRAIMNNKVGVGSPGVTSRRDVEIRAC